MTIKNRIKRIGKLWYFSKKAIKEHGFRHFIFLAVTELRRYKLDVFKPEPSNQYFSSRENEINYNNWITLDENNSIVLSTKKFELYPCFTIIIFIDDHNRKILDDTLTSIYNQNYENISICIYDKKENKINGINLESSKLQMTKVTSFQKTLDEVKGDYSIFCNSGDIFTPYALIKIINKINENKAIDLLYGDEDESDEFGNRTEPFFKPDWSPELFLHSDYISNCFIVANQHLKDLHMESKGRVMRYELLLKITEKIKCIEHIPSVLISVKKINQSQNKKSLQKKGVELLASILKQRKIDAVVEDGIIPYTFKIKFKNIAKPKITVIIPSKDNVVLLKRCIERLRKTNYDNFEIIIIDNNSEKKDTLSYLSSLSYRIIRYEEPFNFAKMNNVAAAEAKGDFLLFMNDDVAALDSEWILEMISICQQPGIGVVGPKLVYGNDSVQHVGIAILRTGSGFHPMNGMDSRARGYFGFLNTVRNCSAVTGACLLIHKKIFDEVKGFDEKFDLYYNDTDLCLKVWDHGYRVVYTPFAKLLHQGSSKIKEYSTAFYTVENHYDFISKWPFLKQGDPFYNPNFGWDYNLEMNEES